MYRLVLWGMGKEYNRRVNLLKMYEKSADITIAGIVAKDAPNCLSVDGWNLLKKEELLQSNFDYIIIQSDKYFGEISKEIVELGISQKKVINAKVLDIPYFDWQKYIEIKEKRLTIITNNCMGGMLYNTLGLECISPFKNLWVDPLVLCQKFKDIKGWIHKAPQFKEWQVDIHNGKSYPVGCIDDMVIHFNHDYLWEEAVAKWNRRKEKINLDALFLMIYAENQETIELFSELANSGIKGVCFVSEQFAEYAKANSVYVLKLMPGQKEFYETVNSNVTIEKNGMIYDLLGMVMGEKHYRMA